jgi:hypothetical protein
MSDLGRMQPEKLERMKLDACMTFGPMIVREALHRLAQTYGAACLDKFERAMIDRIEAHQADIPNLEDVKEFAVEQLYAEIKDAREFPDNKQPLEPISTRRTQGRSEQSETLEEQLQTGLEDTFPASDPPAVVSTAISRGGPKHANENEHLRHKRASQTKPG